MKALVLVENGKLELTERAVPVAAPGECLLRIDAVGICSSDLSRAFSNGAYAYPLVMGHEMSGTVLKAGDAVRRVSEGQRVVVFPLLPCGGCAACEAGLWAQCWAYDYYGSRRDGGLQERLAVKEWNLIPVPDGLDPVMACLCEPIAVAIHAANLADERSREGRICVIGAGLLGITVARRLSDLGGSVTLFDRNAFKRRLASRIGIPTGSPDRLRDLKSECSLVVVAAGAPECFEASVEIAQSGGVVIWLGNILGPLTLSPSAVSGVLRKELQIKGSWNSTYRLGQDDDWSAAIRMIETTAWLREAVSHRIRLEETAEVLRDAYARKSHHRPHGYVKIVVDMQME